MHRRTLHVGLLHAGPLQAGSIAVLLLALAACNRSAEPVAPPSTTPDGAVRAGLVLTRNGDFDGLLRSTLPDADYKAWRAEWAQARAKQPPPTAQQRAQFAQTMQKLTEAGAEDKLYKQLQPRLADLRAHRDRDLPMLVGILQAAGSNVVADAGGLSPSQKQQASAAIEALAAWARGADFTDADKAKQAIIVVCATARQLDLKTLDQARALDYTQSMARYRTAWNGLKALLKIYGLDLDASFDAGQGGDACQRWPRARACAKPSCWQASRSSAKSHLVMQGGHWYDADRLAAWRAGHLATASGAARPPAPAASVLPFPSSRSARPARPQRCQARNGALTGPAGAGLYNGRDGILPARRRRRARALEPCAAGAAACTVGAHQPRPGRTVQPARRDAPWST